MWETQRESDHGVGDVRKVARSTLPRTGSRWRRGKSIVREVGKRGRHNRHGEGVDPSQKRPQIGRAPRTRSTTRKRPDSSIEGNNSRLGKRGGFQKKPIDGVSGVEVGSETVGKDGTRGGEGAMRTEGGNAGGCGNIGAKAREEDGKQLG
ncbi:hypothetical protein C8R45DRAFT_1029349 [Mycena sanguinolenta]|nr:hypothetical protein C8R45DRAFT_1029349 [Mycena sanguinolenta]